MEPRGTHCMIAILAIGKIDLCRGVDLAKDQDHYKILSTIMNHASETMLIGRESNVWGL